MLLSAESRGRHRFVEQSIAAARDVFASHQGVRERLGPLADTLLRLCDVTYVPNVKDGMVFIPRRYQGEVRVPVLAMRPDDQWRLSADFAKLAPSQYNQAVRLVEAWQPRHDSPTAIVDRLEQRALEFDNSQKGKPLRNCFTNNTNILAQVCAGRTAVPIDLDCFSNGGNQLRKHLSTSPLMCFRYEGSDTPKAGASTVAHEQLHILQFWAEGLFTPLQKSERTRQQYKRELQASSIGACVAVGLHAEGYTFTPADQKNILVEQARLETNEGRKDPFDPNGTLINLLRTQGLDLVYD